MTDSISCQDVINFAENYATLSGQDLKTMAKFERIEGNPVCERLKRDLEELSEDETRIKLALAGIKENQERARKLLKEFGFE